MACQVIDPDRGAWRVGIENPRDPSTVIAVVLVRRRAVATSGAAHRGQLVLDGRTGRPVGGVAAVTVIGPSLTWPDGATTIVNGPLAYGASAASTPTGREHTGR